MRAVLLLRLIGFDCIRYMRSFLCFVLACLLRSMQLPGIGFNLDCGNIAHARTHVRVCACWTLTYYGISNKFVLKCRIDACQAALRERLHCGCANRMIHVTQTMEISTFVNQFKTNNLIYQSLFASARWRRWIIGDTDRQFQYREYHSIVHWIGTGRVMWNHSYYFHVFAIGESCWCEWTIHRIRCMTERHNIGTVLLKEPQRQLST